MSVEEYLAALDAKLQELEGFIASWVVEREIDTNLDVGFISGRITFADGSRLAFSEQLPTERQKFRLHYIDTQNDLIVRWDSAPHHRGLSTFPFHNSLPAF
jgi:hypothetical protein